MGQIREEVGASSLISIVGNGTRVLVSLATTILISRWLGASDFGDASLIISSIAFLYYLLACGFDHSLPFFVSRLLSDGHHKEAVQSLKIAIISSAVASTAAALIILFTLPHLLEMAGKSHLYWPTLIFLAQMPIGAFANILGAFLRGEKRFLPNILKDQILIPMGGIAGAFVFVYLANYGAAGFGMAQLLGFSLGLVYITYVYFKTPRLRTTTSLGQPGDGLPTEITPSSMIRFSLPVGLANAVEPLVVHSSVIIGGLFFMAADVGRFSASFRIAFFGQFFLQSIAPIFSPYISESHKKGDLSEVRNLHQNVQFWCAKWAIFFGFTVLLAGQYLMMPFGSDFDGSEGILLGLTIGCMFEGVFGGARQSLLMMGRNFLNLIDFILAALLNIYLSYFMSQKFGILGLAAAFSITLIFLNLLRSVQLWWISKILPFSKGQTFYLFGATFLLIGLAGTLRRADLSQTTGRIAALVLMFGAFMALFWRDRDILRKVLRRGQ